MTFSIDYPEGGLQQPPSENMFGKTLRITRVKFLSGTVPGYLSSCLSLHKPRRANLRSASDTTQLTQQNTPIRQQLDFHTYVTLLHYSKNSLPIPMRKCDSLQVFKKSLKTYLYPNVV